MLSRLWTARLLFGVLCGFILQAGARADTSTVTVNQTNTLTTPFLPSALSSTQVGNSPAWKDRANVLGFLSFTEGYEELTPAAAVNLDFDTFRTKGITLDQNTTFTPINIPTATTNIETMILQVTGDGSSVVAFNLVDFQTPMVDVPDAGVITLYALRARSGAVQGYVASPIVTPGQIIGPLTPGYIPVASSTTNVTDSAAVQTSATNPSIWGFGSTNNWLYSDQRDGTGGDPYKFNFGVGWDVFGGGGLAAGFGNENTAFGGQALALVDDGSANSALGWNALYFITSGTFNTGIGRSVGATLTTGSNNTLLGTAADVSGSGNNNETVVGAFAIGNGSNTVTLGDTNVTAIFMGSTQVFPTTGSLWASAGGVLYPDPAVDQIYATNATSMRLDLETDGGDNHVGLMAGAINKVAIDSGSANVVALSPDEDDGDLPFFLYSTVTHTSGNMFEIKNNGTLTFQNTYNGAIVTGDPGVGGTGAIKFGGILTCSAITLVVTNYIPVSLNGNTNYVIPLATFAP